MPTSHDREDDECVDGSTVSPATVYVDVMGMNTMLSVVYICTVACIYFGGHCSIDQYMYIIHIDQNALSVDSSGMAAQGRRNRWQGYL